LDERVEEALCCIGLRDKRATAPRTATKRVIPKKVAAKEEFFIVKEYQLYGRDRENMLLEVGRP
jgi:hypothetical protein